MRRSCDVTGSTAEAVAAAVLASVLPAARRASCLSCVSAPMFSRAKPNAHPWQQNRVEYPYNTRTTAYHDATPVDPTCSATAQTCDTRTYNRHGRLTNQMVTCYRLEAASIRETVRSGHTDLQWSRWSVCSFAVWHRSHHLKTL